MIVRLGESELDAMPVLNRTQYGFSDLCVWLDFYEVSYELADDGIIFDCQGRQVHAKVGDYIIRDKKGVFYRAVKQVFDRAYEIIDTSSPPECEWGVDVMNIHDQAMYLKLALNLQDIHIDLKTAYIASATFLEISKLKGNFSLKDSIATSNYATHRFEERP